MWQKRSTAPGPRIPRPTKPTLTVVILGAVRPSTFFCPAGRAGVSTTMVPLSQCHLVLGLRLCAPALKQVEAATSTAIAIFRKLFFMFFGSVDRLVCNFRAKITNFCGCMRMRVIKDVCARWICERKSCFLPGKVYLCILLVLWKRRHSLE